MCKEKRVKRLKPLLIKSEPEREYVHYIHSDDNLPYIPEDNFTQKREITIDSYSETISSESSSEDRTLTAEMEDTMSREIMFRRRHCYKNRSLIIAK